MIAPFAVSRICRAASRGSAGSRIVRELSGRPVIPMARAAPSGYRSNRCGQAGQLAQGPHALPAAATISMGASRHGARQMSLSDSGAGGVPPEEALNRFCSDVVATNDEIDAQLRPRLVLDVGRTLAGINTEQPGKVYKQLPPSAANRAEACVLADRDARIRSRHALLVSGDLIASGFDVFSRSVIRQDLPAEFWRFQEACILPLYRRMKDCVRLRGRWWSDLTIRPRAGAMRPMTPEGEAHTSPGWVHPPEHRSAGMAVPEAPVKSLNLQQQHYDRDACEIMAEVHRKGIAFADVLNQWIDAGKNTKVPVNGRAVGVSADAYKKAIERYSVKHGRVQERRSRTS